MQGTLTVKRGTLRSATDAGFWEATGCWVRAYGPLPWAVAGAPWSLCDDSLILSFRGGAGDEESRTALKILRARFLAEFTLSTQSEIPSLRSGRALRFAQDDSEGLGMTLRRRFSHTPEWPADRTGGSSCGRH